MSISLAALTLPSAAYAHPPEGVPVIMTLTSSANPSAFDEDVTYFVTLVTSDGGSPAVTDYIEFQDDRNDISGCGDVPLTATGTPGTYTATCDEPGSAMPAGAHSIAALFAGDAIYDFGSGSLTQVVELGTTTTTITSPSPGSSVVYASESGSPLEVSVSAAAGVAQSPSGSVDIYAGSSGAGSVLCQASLSGGGAGVSTGSCSIDDSTLIAGVYTLTAVYGGDDSFAGSTSTGVDLTVNQVATQMSVFPVPGYAFYGAESGNFFTVEVGGANIASPSGSVTITADGTNLVVPGSCPASNGGGNKCFIDSATALPAAATPYTVTTSYAGDANFTAASTTSLLSVYPAATTTTLNVTPSPVLYGGESSLSIKATVTSATTGAPSGTVVVQDAARLLCTISLTAVRPDAASGTCPGLSADQLPPGSHGLTAAYEGDGNYSSSVSAARALTVDATPRISIVSNKLSFNPGTNSAPVKLTCADAPCSGTLSLTETITVRQRTGGGIVVKRRTVGLASASYSLKKGTSGRAYLPLTSAQHSLLSQLTVKNPLRETLVATVKGGSRTTKTVLVS
jgi:hypothetical protein